MAQKRQKKADRASTAESRHGSDDWNGRKAVKVLIVEDSSTMQKLLEHLMKAAGHDVFTAGDGAEALELAGRERPEIVLTDWMMPNLDGVELCQRLRSVAPGQGYVYVILLTARDQKADLLQGLEAGADDYIVKPFDPDELRARVRVGERIVRLEAALRGRNEELEQSLQTIRRLKGLLPICMYCKRIRSDENYWQQIEAYIHEQTGTDFSHGICPECFEQRFPEYHRRAQGGEESQQGSSTEKES
jgi:CheY-like chemotaxis protein